MQILSKALADGSGCHLTRCVPIKCRPPLPNSKYSNHRNRNSMTQNFQQRQRCKKVETKTAFDLQKNTKLVGMATMLTIFNCHSIMASFETTRLQIMTQQTKQSSVFSNNKSYCGQLHQQYFWNLTGVNGNGFSSNQMHDNSTLLQPYHAV